MVNVAIIGCGYWGPNLIRVFHQLGSCKLKALCDLDQTKLNRMAEMYPGVHTTRDYKEILGQADVDAVVIATPIHTHYPLSKEFLKAGKHVLVEKPLTKTSDEAKELIDIAKKNNKVLMVGHTFEYSPPIAKIKELITSGEIGSLSHIEARRHNLGRLQTDYNVIWDLAPHDISILLHTTGQKINEVRAITHKAYLVKDHDSIAQVDLLLDNNISAHLSLSWLYPIKMRDMTFIGNKKMIYYDDANPIEKIRVHDKGISSKFDFNEVAISSTIYREGDIHIPYIPTIEPLRLECSDFVESIMANKHPRTDGENGLRVIKVLEAIEKSANSGGHWVKVEND